MATRLIRSNVRTILLVGSTLAAMLAGSAIAQAPADNPPGSQFENQGERLEQGQRATPSRFSRAAKHAREVEAQYKSSKANARAFTHRKHRKPQHSQ